MLVQKRVNNSVNIEPVYAERQHDPDKQEVVLTVYGGDSLASAQIIAQTEAMASLRETEKGIEVKGLNGLKLERYQATRVLYVNRMTMFSSVLGKEIALHADLPITLRPGDTFTVEFLEKWLVFT